MAQPPELRGDLVRLVTSPEFMVEFTLRLLGLQGCADTVVGDAKIRCVRKAACHPACPAPPGAECHWEHATPAVVVLALGWAIGQRGPWPVCPMHSSAYTHAPWCTSPPISAAASAAGSSGG